MCQPGSGRGSLEDIVAPMAVIVLPPSPREYVIPESNHIRDSEHISRRRGGSHHGFQIHVDTTLSRGVVERVNPSPSVIRPVTLPAVASLNVSLPSHRRESRLGEIKLR